MTNWNAIAAHITAVTDKPFVPKSPRNIGGGCINQTVKLSDGEHAFFVKLNSLDRLDMFEAEAAGLAEMAATRTIRVPEPLCFGTCESKAYLVMEYVDLGGSRRDSHVQAGLQLAAMHRTSLSQFGWERDNTIGSTAQPNNLDTEWISFWRELRLGFQLQLAARHGYGGRLQEQGDKLLDLFPALIDHAPLPSLLHGDLWGGNMSFDRHGHPVIYDPAVYFGDREADLAMTELFGGFSRDFYTAYEKSWPLAPGYSTRKMLYNLYHVLNHLNLFGSSYLGQAQDMIDRLLAELR